MSSRIGLGTSNINRRSSARTGAIVSAAVLVTIFSMTGCAAHTTAQHGSKPVASATSNASLTSAVNHRNISSTCILISAIGTIVQNADGNRAAGTLTNDQYSALMATIYPILEIGLDDPNFGLQDSLTTLSVLSAPVAGHTFAPSPNGDFYAALSAANLACQSNGSPVVTYDATPDRPAKP